MSEVNSPQDSLKVSTVVDIEVPATGQVAIVEVGPADVFALDANGVRLPLVTIASGGVVFGATAPARIVVVPRQGGSVALVAQDYVDSDSMLEVFIGVLDAQLGSPAHSLIDVDRADFAQSFAGVVEALWKTERETRAQGSQASRVTSAQAIDSTMDRIAYSTRSLNNPVLSTSPNQLVAALTLIGIHDGFAIKAPTPEAMRRTTDRLRFVAHTSGVRYRKVTFVSGWQESSQACFLAFLAHDDNPPKPVALTRGTSGYRLQSAEDTAPRSLTPELAKQLLPEAYEFYAPLTPDSKASAKDVISLGLRGMGGSWWLAATMALGVALLGLLTPLLTHVIVGQVIPSGDRTLLIQIGAALAIAAAVTFVFSLVQNFTVSSITQRATRKMQAAFWDRVLSLPAAFFRNYSSGDLAVRVLAVDTLQTLVSPQVISAVLAAIFGLVNLFLMFVYSPALGIAGLFIILLTVGMFLLSVRWISRLATDSLTMSRNANGWLVQMLQGLMKIRLANAEPRIEAQFLDITRQQTVAASNQTIVIGRINAWFTFIASAASALFYFVILLQWQGAAAPISTATYMAFASAYGMTFAAVSGLTSLISPIANAGPTFKMLEPIMTELPETAGGRQDPGKLTGRIELRDVFFRYTPDGPMILKGLNIVVEPGTMVALTGTSGAGKSTITRQLLGFDRPERGQVLYDGRDLQSLDPTLVRNQMGVVVQEGQITRGTIMRNILGATSTDEALAWNAAEKASLADDIRNMPMGMNTIVDPGNVSGGQAQRILLARALVLNPSILILDEATSALDNASQAIVTQAMQALDATRIVIAHRLSTIRSADKIIVIDAGVAVESGTYDELLAMDGVFAALVKRQVT
jgi:NHLM bacteriocin system ABC transporter ATP-binding protein